MGSYLQEEIREVEQENFHLLVEILAHKINEGVTHLRLPRWQIDMLEHELTRWPMLPSYDHQTIMFRGVPVYEEENKNSS